jgi:hypothetical protein
MGKAKIQFCSRAASSTGCLGSGLRFAQNDSVGSCHEIVGRHTGTGLINGFPAGCPFMGPVLVFTEKLRWPARSRRKRRTRLQWTRENSFSGNAVIRRTENPAPAGADQTSPALQRGVGWKKSAESRRDDQRWRTAAGLGAKGSEQKRRGARRQLP